MIGVREWTCPARGETGTGSGGGCPCPCREKHCARPSSQHAPDPVPSPQATSHVARCADGDGQRVSHTPTKDADDSMETRINAEALAVNPLV